VSKGSWIHDDVVRHFKRCSQCCAADPESARIKHRDPGKVSEDDVPAEKIAALCPDGRSIYRSYLRWLADPDD
jgi:hypothetical protein